MAAAMELPGTPLMLGVTMPAAAVARPPRPRRWPMLLVEAPLLGAAVILNATIVGAVVGVPLFFVALSLLTLPRD